MKQATFGSFGAHINDRGWRIEAAVRGVAGTLVLISAVLAAFVSPWWLLLTAFVGANLLQSAFSGYCLMNNLIAFLFPALRARQ
jgi:Inner membrane protein YgaP-like, transmembrane domain